MHRWSAGLIVNGALQSSWLWLWIRRMHPRCILWV